MLDLVPRSYARCITPYHHVALSPVQSRTYASSVKCLRCARNLDQTSFSCDPLMPATVSQPVQCCLLSLHQPLRRFIGEGRSSFSLTAARRLARGSEGAVASAEVAAPGDEEATAADPDGACE